MRSTSCPAAGVRQCYSIPRTGGPCSLQPGAAARPVQPGLTPVQIVNTLQACPVGGMHLVYDGLVLLHLHLLQT